MSEEGLLGFGMGIMVADLHVWGMFRSLAPGHFPFALAIEDFTSSWNLGDRILTDSKYSAEKFPSDEYLDQEWSNTSVIFNN